MCRKAVPALALLLAGLCGARSLTAQCPAPGAPTINLFSTLPAAKNQTYVLGWTAASGLDAGGRYLIERSASPSFDGITPFLVSTTSASLTSTATGTFYHRVRAVPSCGTPGAPSNAVPVTIVDGSPVVIFGTQPVAVVRNAGDPPVTSTFEVWNVGGERFLGYVSPNNNTGFFTLTDSIVDLEPGQKKTYTIEYESSGTFINTPNTYQGSMTIVSVGGAQAKAYPWALVNLTVGPRAPARRTGLANDTAAPVFSTDFASFQATPENADPPPVAISITNPRPIPLSLAAETGPDGWLAPDREWSRTPLAPSETRTITVGVQRVRGQTGGVLPRYAFLTVRTKDGQSARIQFQDLDETSGGPCASRPALAAGAPSLIVPSVVTLDRADATVPGGHVIFISKLLLSNIGVDSITADVYFTPDRGEPPIDGYDCSTAAKVLKATVEIPGSDVLVLTDPLAKLFHFSPADRISGQLEIRSAKIAQIRADSVVDSPNGKGGLYGFQLPVVKRGVGAVKSVTHYISGLSSDPVSTRSNIILSETSGKPATARVTVYNDAGAVLFQTTKVVPAYAKVQTGLNDDSVFQGRTVPSASVEITVTDGDGSVAALATVIDRASQDASTFLGRPLPTGTTARRRTPLATGPPFRWIVPSVVNGFNSKPGRGPFPYESVLSIVNPSTQPLNVQLTYNEDKEFGGAVRQSQTITVAGRQTKTFSNVLRDVFNVSGTSGNLVLDMDRQQVILSSRVFSRTDEGSFGDAIPVYPFSTSAATGSDQRRLLADGFENSINDGRGARTNLILTEIDGKAAEVEVRLFEKSKERSGAIGTKQVPLLPFQKVQLNKIFDQLLTGGKDRTNVLCEVAAVPGSQGRVVALGTRVDNVTADSKILVMTPIGESPGDPAIGF